MSRRGRIIAYGIGWFVAGPLDSAWNSIRWRLHFEKKRSISGRKRILVANSVGLISLFMKLGNEPEEEEIEAITCYVLKTFRLRQNNHDNIRKLLEGFSHSSLNVDALTSTFPRYIGPSVKNRANLFHLFISVLTTINDVRWEQKFLLLELAEVLKIPFIEWEEFFKYTGDGKMGAPDAPGTFYYRFLGLEPKCRREEIQKTYHGIVKLLHPDLHGRESDEILKVRVRAMQKLNEIYTYLLSRV